MSALLAVERFADRAVVAGVSLSHLSQRLLAECNNLAMPGLVVGLLVRHLEKVTDELDPWLCVPEVWELEFRRAMQEGALHVQGADASDVSGRANRRASFREVAAQLVATALARDDRARLDDLSRLGEELVTRAEARVTRPGTRVDAEAQKWLLTVRGWASLLQARYFRAVQVRDGDVGIAYEPPQEVAEGLAPDNARLARIRAAYELLSRYVPNDRASTIDAAQIVADIVTAKSLIEDPPTQERSIVIDAPTATAAMALRAHALGDVSLPSDMLNWATAAVLEVGLAQEDSGRYSGERFDMGADRSAARALPLLLLPCFGEDAGESRLTSDVHAKVSAAVARLAASHIDEVRREVAVAMAQVWTAPCTPGYGGTYRCRHAEALAAVVGAARMCRLGPFDDGAQRRLEVALDGSIVEALRDLTTADILVPRLTGPIIAVADCVRSSCCGAGDAAPLLQALLGVHRRGAAHWADKRYHTDHDDRRFVAEVLLKLAGSGRDQELIQHVDLFADHPHALEQLLDDLAQLATYDEGHRSALSAVWPRVMDQVLSAYDEGRGNRRDRWSDRAVAALIPAPRISAADGELEATLVAARVGWPTPEELASRIERWLPLAAGEGWCVDALIGLLDVAPFPEQASRGLPWMLRLVEGHIESAQGSFRLPSWLQRVRDAAVLDATTRPIYQRIVDGLAASGDHRAVELQQLDE